MSEQLNASQQTVDTVNANIEQLKTDGWSRVSPLAIIYFFAKKIWGVGNSLVYMLPIFALNFDEVKNNVFIASMVLLALLSVILVSSILNYLFYFYKFGSDKVEIKQGVFNKSHLDLPFSKIQNVKIIQPFYYRFKQYSFIELDTAGSAQQEAKIIALPLDLAESFKQLILAIKEDKPQQDTSSISNNSVKPNLEKEILLNERSLKDLVIHGISNNRVWIVLGAMAPFYNSISENIGNILNRLGFDIVSYLDYESQSMGLFVLHVLSLVMLIMLVIVSFSVLGSIFVFYNYRLSRQGDRYIRRSGLFTKHEVSMRLSRIQIAVQQQDWLDVIIKRVNLRFEQNTSGYNSNSQAGNINNASKLIVPSVKPEESNTLIQNAFDVKAFNTIPFVNISKRYMWRLLMLLFLPVMIIMGSIVVLNDFGTGGFILVFGLALLMLVLIYVRWWRWAYYICPNYVYIRKGLLGCNYYVFPIGKTQQVAFKQSFFMHRHNLASIQFVLASGSYTIPFVQADQARKHADLALLHLAQFKPAWM